MKFETAVVTTTAIELWPVSTKKKSFKYHNIIRITALSPQPSHWGQIHRDNTRMWVNFATIHKLTAGSAVGSKRRQPISSLSQIFLICTPSCEGLTAGSYFYSSAKSLVYIGCECMCGWVCLCGWVAAWRVRNYPLGLNTRHSGMCLSLLLSSYVAKVCF